MIWKMPIATAITIIFSAVALHPSAGHKPQQGLGGTASLPPGFLPRDQLPNSLQLLPPPPEPGSPAFVLDQADARKMRLFENSARWRVAASDASLAFPQAPANFSCAAAVRIDPGMTPRTYNLLGRSLVDIGLSTYRAKDHYRRTRPFVLNRTKTCYPKDEFALRQDGSYPSGHSAIGWGWALILAELVPDRGNEILLRGREYGQSRSVCGAHWQSDVDAGRLVAAATVARLHADASFRQELDAARRELDEARSKAMPDQDVCAAETAALTLLEK